MGAGWVDGAGFGRPCEPLRAGGRSDRMGAAPICKDMAPKMTITVELTPEAERKLRVLVSRSGQDVATHDRGLIDHGIGAATSLETIFAPVLARFEASGMTDDDLASLVEMTR